MIRQSFAKVSRKLSTTAVSNSISVQTRLYNFFTNPALYVGGFIFGIGSFLYIGRQERKNRDLTYKEIAINTIVTTIEAEDMQEQNELSLGFYKKCLEGIDKRFPTGFASADEFALYFSEILEKEIKDDTNLNLKLCHLERLLMFLEVEAGCKEKGEATKIDSFYKAKVSTRRLLAALALCIKGNSSQKMRLLFELYGKDSEADALSTAEFTKIIEDLLQTFHFPIAYQLTEIKSEMPYFGINQWRKVYAAELVNRALETREKEMKVPVETPVNIDEFLAMLSSKPLCIWDECRSKRKKVKLMTDIKASDLVR